MNVAEEVPDLAASVRGLVKRYGSVVAVDGLDLEVRRGECFGLLGPNGAGKTTTIEILEGLLPCDAGEVRVLGRSWSRRDERALRERLGIQLQEKRDAWVGKLSGGQRQRLSVACALVNDPELLFLDEPTTGLDPQSRRQLWTLVAEFRARGGTVLLTTHYMEEAEQLCDRVAIVDRGKVIATGTPAELIALLGAEHVVAFAVQGHLDLEPVRALPTVVDVREEPGRIALTVGAPHLAVPALLAELSRQSVELASLTTHHATLEDVFVSLTGRTLRDD